MKKIILLFLALISLNSFSQQYRYYKAQLHCHSTNSDGVMNPGDVAQEYLSRGYEIVCLTDHNCMTPASAYAAPGILTINSEEYTFDKHMNGFFLNHTVDASGFTPQQAIDSVRAQGGLIQFNHPVVALTNDWSFNFSQFMALSNGPDFIEVHNAGTDMIPLATFNMAIWDSLLMNGRKIWGTSTDDMHKLAEGYLIPTIDIGWVMIRLETLCEDSVKAALLRGDFYGSNGIEISNYSVEGNTINISSPNATKIKFIGEGGQSLGEVIGSVATYTRTTERYVRVELQDDGVMGVGKKYAFTQPVFFTENTSNTANNYNDTNYHVASYPNPCSNNLNIGYNTKRNTNVTIEIFDLTGQKVTSVNNSKQLDGYYEIPFDVSNLASGIYLYTVNIDGFKITKKFSKL